MEEYLQKLIALPTITDDLQSNAKALTYLADFFASRGMFVKKYQKNGKASFVATTKPHTLKPKILLVTHIDVVPAPERLFRLEKTADTYYGRGVLDMKFAIAAFMHLVNILHQELASYDFGIMVTSDEEHGGANGVGYLVNDIGYRPEVCIVPDGGMNWEIETYAKGVYWIDLSASGVTAHASRPWEGEHAVHKLLEALSALRAAYPHSDDPHSTLFSVGTITGGETANQLAEHAHAKLDIRTGSLADHQAVPHTIAEIAQRFGVTASIDVMGDPCINDLHNFYIQAFRSLVTEVTGAEHAFSSSLAATDGRHFAIHNIPCVIVQPTGGDHHTDKEWLSIEGSRQFYEILQRFVVENA